MNTGFRIWLLLMAYWAVNPVAQAQGYSTGSARAVRKFEQALECYRDLDEACALESLRRAVRIDEEFVEAYRLLAQIHYEKGRLEKAIGYFRTSLEMDPDGNPDAYRLLAGMHLQIGAYDRALELAETFLSFPPEAVSHRDQGRLIREKCLFAREAMKNPVPFHPVNLGDSVNSEFSEYWPSLTVNENRLMFTVLLPIDPEMSLVPANLQEDIYYSVRGGGGWRSREAAGSPLNTRDNEGAQTMTADGKLLYFTACNRPEGNGQCDIYVSALKEGAWQLPQNIGAPVNSPYSEKHPTISADGRFLLFASNRPGGRGSYDIWISEKQTDGWGIPRNLGDSVNTPGMEQSPFLHPDQQTLYFSSAGWPGMGQGDLFVCRSPAFGNWSRPLNLGYPLNTHHDEIGLAVNARGDRAYFASDRLSGKDTDIYSFRLPRGKRPVQVSYMEGRVYDAGNMRGLGATMELIDLATEEVVMELQSGSAQGNYLVPLPSEREYALNVSAEGYLFYSDHFSFRGKHPREEPYRKDIPLVRITAGSKVVLRNIFFDTDSHTLKPSSQVELKKILQFLAANPGVRVEISGHTDDRGSAAYNQELSEKRAGAVLGYLVEHGIDPDRLTARGYGEDEPVADNRTEGGRAENRRTELMILER